MKDNPLFSIIIPSYQQGNYIEQTLKSVLNQDYPNKEVIVVDNLSTDGTLEVLKKYKNRINVIREKDGGQTSAINKGIKISKGDILAYLASDDVYEKNTLNMVVDYFTTHPEAEIVYGKGRFIDEKGKDLGLYDTMSPTTENLYIECVLSQPAVFISRKAFEKIGVFDERLNYAMDYDYWIRAAISNLKFGFIDKILADTRLHKESKTVSQKRKMFEEILLVLKKNYHRVSDQAIFNYAYVLGNKPLERMAYAFKAYAKYKQIPKLTGLRHLAILVKATLKKAG
ncbi:MAG: glycosyltransferase family 2 protein [Patescibacteria group bacterium]